MHIALGTSSTQRVLRSFYRLAVTAERPALAAELQTELIAAIDAEYAKQPLDEWVRRLDANDAAYGLFSTTQGFMDHAQMLHNGHVIDVEDPDLGSMKQVGPLVNFKQREWVWPGPAPQLGAARSDVAWTSPVHWQPEPAATALKGPLDGIVVIDLANFAAAPGGPGLLADLGARVMKVEPLVGDPMVAGAVAAGELFTRINRSKERISIDLKHPTGQEVLHRLVAKADVVVHNYRPGVPERLAMDFETLRGHNDRLVYVYGASFGSTGPDSKRPAFDAGMSAMAGGEVLQAGRGNPAQQRQTTDHSALLGVAVACLLGLRERDRSGEAQELETTMLCSAAYLLSDDFIRYAGKPDRPLPDPGQHGLGSGIACIEQRRAVRSFWRAPSATSGFGFAMLWPNQSGSTIRTWRRATTRPRPSSAKCSLDSLRSSGKTSCSQSTWLVSRPPAPGSSSCSRGIGVFLTIL